ncbi:protein Dok-7-like [Megalops cyprinoides]|uniref:protein Dok-7-like n=1 Tax=Megalops cyprinoides TaxID=118141 RepID=UPI00186426F4|nr:protein Dok-7-like [Megalops cyprinoides]
MTDSVVVEGQVRFRDGKKWKSRWVALRKPSPVADCLLLQVYKDKSEKTKGHKERNSITLEDICGLEPGLSYEGVSYTLVIICLSQAVVLGFESKEALLAWDIRIRYSLGEVHRFSVGILPGTKLESGPATLHLCNNLLVIARDFPPTILGQWNLPDLRRYGAVPNGFVFEGGTRCGYWAGVFFLSCVEGEQISFLFDCIVRGMSPTRGPFGLRPALPDLNVNPACLEEQVNHEAEELEKRLSLLSQNSQQSSTADDRSISSSSDTSDSHSDTSTGSRLAVWMEPGMSPGPVEPPSTSAVKGAEHAEVKQCTGIAGGPRPPPKPPCSRTLCEIGRQSSSDSGIATGSHSSYSGSFSSYTVSLDICQGDELGSLLSLPVNFAPDQSPCSCQLREPTQDLESEYQLPYSLRHVYDRPRTLPPGIPKGPNPILSHDQATCLPFIPEPDGGSKEQGEVCANPISTVSASQKKGQVLKSKNSESLPSSEVSFPPYVKPKRRERHKADVGYEIMDGLGVEKTSEPEDRSSYEPMASCGQQKIFHETEDPKASYEHMASSVDVPKRCDWTLGELVDATVPDKSRSDGVTYVNIPVSPAFNKQLHYMELELQDPGSEVRGGGSTKYAHIDIAATETAHRVGTQHAQCREDGLMELEQKKRGTL